MGPLEVLDHKLLAIRLLEAGQAVTPEQAWAMSWGLPRRNPPGGVFRPTGGPWDAPEPEPDRPAPPPPFRPTGGLWGAPEPAPPTPPPARLPRKRKSLPVVAETPPAAPAAPRHALGRKTPPTRAGRHELALREAYQSGGPAKAAQLAWLVPHPQLGEVPPPDPGFEPQLASYDYVIVTFSGGKDSLASLIAVLELAQLQGVDLAGKLELWHHNVDGAVAAESAGVSVPGGEVFMDWPITHAYVKAVAAALGFPVYFSWKVGGFLREMSRHKQRTAPIQWEEPGGTIGQSGGTRGSLGTRRRYPQVSADLKVRWCSAYLKIMVGDAALRGQKRFAHRRTLVISGERAEESPGRARYNVFEPDRTHLGPQRHVDHWRPVHAWTAFQVWDAIRRWGIVPHPAYRAGFGRVSCAFCIFGSPNQWASLQQLMPTGFERIAQLEREYGSTIQRKETVEERAARGSAYEAAGEDAEEGRRLAVQRVYDAPILVSPADWVLPMGAFSESAGPT